MADQPAVTSTDLAHQRTDLAKERTDLALDRTLLAHERTLIAWVRTATSLISFEFTIYTGFTFLSETGAPTPAGWLSPRGFGTSMISTGLAALILAIIQHGRSRESLKQQGYHVQRSLAMVTAVLVAVLGFLSLGLAILDW